MPAHPPARYLASGKVFGALAMLGLIAGCAQPQESAVHYDTTRENTRLEAESHALGRSPRVESQLQLGFGDTGEPKSQEAAEHASASRAIPRPLAEARSFLGTVPCPSSMACDASRFLVTLAPSGEWRARTTMLVGDQPKQTLVEQGCWDVIGDDPLRIALVHVNQETAKADLSFLNNNLLHVHTLNGVQPMLAHRLTRQADLDPIDELKARPALACG